MLFVCHPKILHKHCLQFRFRVKRPQEKLKTMLMQNFGMTNKEYYGMLWYFLEWSIPFMWGSPQTFSLGRKISNFFRELFFGGWGTGGVTFCTFLQQNKLFPTGLKCRSRQKNYDIQTVNCELTNLIFLCVCFLVHFHSI